MGIARMIEKERSRTLYRTHIPKESDVKRLRNRFMREIVTGIDPLCVAGEG